MSKDIHILPPQQSGMGGRVEDAVYNDKGMCHNAFLVVVKFIPLQKNFALSIYISRVSP